MYLIDTFIYTLVPTLPILFHPFNAERHTNM